MTRLIFYIVSGLYSVLSPPPFFIHIQTLTTNYELLVMILIYCLYETTKQPQSICCHAAWLWFLLYIYTIRPTKRWWSDMTVLIRPILLREAGRSCSQCLGATSRLSPERLRALTGSEPFMQHLIILRKLIWLISQPDVNAQFVRQAKSKSKTLDSDIMK